MVKRPNYDPVQYWEQRGNDYTSDPSNIHLPLAALYEFVASNKIESVLDIGSGWGRVYNTFKDIGYTGHYAMCDIAHSMIERCHKETGVRPKWWNGRDLPYKEGQFDISLLIHVLQHCRRPGPMLEEASRVAGRVAIIDAVVVRQPATSHCFHHDWFLQFSRAGLTVEYCAPFYDGTIMLWITRGKDGATS